MPERFARAIVPSVSARDAVDGVRNLVLFAGWGVVWVLSSPSGKVWRNLRDATLTGAAISLGIELAQLFSPVRFASILDLSSNTLGAAVGAFVVIVAARALGAARGAKSFVGLPAALFAVCYLAATFLEGLIPLFRQEELPGAGGGPFERMALAVELFDWGSILQLPIGGLVLFLPAGFFAVAALVEFGVSYRDAARRIAIGGIALFLLVEVARGMLALPIVFGAALVHAIAVASGAFLAAAALPALSRRLRGRERPLALATVYTLVLVLWSWRPFMPELSLENIVAELSIQRFIPLRAHAMRVDLFSVVDVCRQFLLLLPLGGLLAVWPLRSSGPLRAMLPALYLAILLEGGQILVAGRMFDITDLLIQCAGVTIGWVLMRRTGYRPYGEAL